MCYSSAWYYILASLELPIGVLHAIGYWLSGANASGWAQAAGSLFAIVAAIRIASKQRRADQAVLRSRGRSLALGLQMEILEIALHADRCITILNISDRSIKGDACSSVLSSLAIPEFSMLEGNV